MKKPTKTNALLLLISISLLSILLLISIPISKPYLKHNNLHIIAQSHCHGTLYPDLCISTLSLLSDLPNTSMSDILCHTLNITLSEVYTFTSNITYLMTLNSTNSSPLSDCQQLLESAADDINSAHESTTRDLTRYSADIQTALSAAMTSLDTCLDGLNIDPNKTMVRPYIEPQMVNISRLLSNSLALLQRNPHCRGKKSHSKAMNTVDGFPVWLEKRERRVLEVDMYDIVVAQDGTGNFTRITEALEVVPRKSEKRFVVYIKAGAYFEYVKVDKKMSNVMFLGDGIEHTWIKGNRSIKDNYTTFNSATLVVEGKGFMAKGISVENYAGPIKKQAVAVRSDSDKSVFYQCRLIGYQDTLYTHKNRQFYRDCDIYGTIDIIFGNSAAVFQNCNLYARMPLNKQKNMYTAQGRFDPGQTTGFSIIHCKVSADADLAANKSAFPTYLGRPWKNYSRTVYMLSYIDDVLDPKGWFEWSGDFGLSTLYYGEYMNTGPGSNTSARVTWPGYRVINVSSEASQFDVGNFINGSEWLPSYGVPYYLNLTDSW